MFKEGNSTKLEPSGCHRTAAANVSYVDVTVCCFQATANTSAMHAPPNPHPHPDMTVQLSSPVENAFLRVVPTPFRLTPISSGLHSSENKVLVLF